jgi:hypothetical protein
MNSIIFWDMTPCSLLSCNRRFGGTYRLHIQGRAELFLRPWRLRRYIPPKRRLQLKRLHDVISQKMILFIIYYYCFKTLYSRRQNLDALVLINLFKNRTECFSVMDTVGLRLPHKQIRDFSTFKASNVSRLSPSTRCVTAANSICRSLGVFSKHAVLSEDTFSLA